jgi:tetratricopeptide (TPR) repeat protein
MLRSGFIHAAVVLAMAGILVDSVAAATADRVKLARGNESGEVSDMTPLEVTLNRGAPGSKKIPVNQIKSILFDSEPAELAQARVNVANGAYTKAQQLLEKIDATQVKRDLIKQDLEFYQAYIAAKLALGGEGEIIDAGRRLNTFVRSYPNNYHYLEASEVMGDLLMASGRFEPAQKQYAELAKAPWPEYRIRAAVTTGRALQALNKHEEAIGQFDAALAISDDGAVDAQNQKQAATIGKAVSLAETAKVDEAVGIIEKIIENSDPQQKELQARAYNALGNCYEKGKKDKDALIAFLHVDVLYNTVPDSHAEALAHLVPLWKSVGQEERSREAREQLQHKYASSRWAKGAQ